MKTQLSIHAIHQGGMLFEASSGEHSVKLDYPLQPGPTSGMTPLEVLMSSLAVCAGSTLALLLGRMKQPVEGLEVAVRGTRREEHPTLLTKIDMEFVLTGEGLEEEAVKRALDQAEKTVCPVWAMLKPGTEITSSFRMER